MADQYLTPEERARLREWAETTHPIGAPVARVLRLLDERDALDAEAQGYRAQAETITCGWCKEAFRRDDGAGITWHMASCEKRPDAARFAETLNDAAFADLATARQEATEQRARAEKAEAKLASMIAVLRLDVACTQQHERGPCRVRHSARSRWCKVCRVLAEVDHG